MRILELKSLKLYSYNNASGSVVLKDNDGRVYSCGKSFAKDKLNMTGKLF